MFTLFFQFFLSCLFRHDLKAVVFSKVVKGASFPGAFEEWVVKGLLCSNAFGRFEVHHLLQQVHTFVAMELTEDAVLAIDLTRELRKVFEQV